MNYVGSFPTVNLIITDYLLDLRQFLAHSNPAASIRVLTWLDDPHLFAQHRILDKILVVVWRVKCLFEFGELSISKPVFDMVGEGQVIKGLLLR